MFVRVSLNIACELVEVDDVVIFSLLLGGVFHQNSGVEFVFVAGSLKWVSLKVIQVI